MNVERVRSDRLEKIDPLVNNAAIERARPHAGQECSCACEEAVEVELRRPKLSDDCTYRPACPPSRPQAEPWNGAPHCGTPDPARPKPERPDLAQAIRDIKRPPKQDEVPRKPKVDPDFNGDGVVQLDDIYSYLKSYGGKQKSADVNRDGSINGRDFLAFAKAYCKASEGADVAVLRKAWSRIKSA